MSTRRFSTKFGLEAALAMFATLIKCIKKRTVEGGDLYVKKCISTGLYKK